MGTEVMEVAGKLKSKWLSKDQIKVIKGFGRRFRTVIRSGVIRNGLYETEDASHDHIYSPTFLIKEVESLADLFEERGMDVYISVKETGVWVSGMYPRTWDGEFESWHLGGDEDKD